MFTHDYSTILTSNIIIALTRSSQLDKLGIITKNIVISTWGDDEIEDLMMKKKSRTKNGLRDR